MRTSQLTSRTRRVHPRKPVTAGVTTGEAKAAGLTWVSVYRLAVRCLTPLQMTFGHIVPHDAAWCV